jgi:hypothetical protein
MSAEQSMFLLGLSFGKVGLYAAHRNALFFSRKVKSTMDGLLARRHVSSTAGCQWIWRDTCRRWERIGLVITIGDGPRGPERLIAATEKRVMDDINLRVRLSKRSEDIDIARRVERLGGLEDVARKDGDEERYKQA